LNPKSDRKYFVLVTTILVLTNFYRHFTEVAALSAATSNQERSAMLNEKIELTNELGRLPSFRYAGRKFCLMNLGFDVEIGGVTYHLFSEFSGRGEMGAVIDMIELERNRRNSA